MRKATAIIACPITLRACSSGSLAAPATSATVTKYGQMTATC